MTQSNFKIVFGFLSALLLILSAQLVPNSSASPTPRSMTQLTASNPNESLQLSTPASSASSHSSLGEHKQQHVEAIAESDGSADGEVEEDEEEKEDKEEEEDEKSKEPRENFIITLNKNATKEQLDEYENEIVANGGIIRHRYESIILKGFAVSVRPSHLQSLQQDPQVSSVEPDSEVHI